MKLKEMTGNWIVNMKCGFYWSNRKCEEEPEDSLPYCSRCKYCEFCDPNRVDDWWDSFDKYIGRNVIIKTHVGTFEGYVESLIKDPEDSDDIVIILKLENSGCVHIQRSIIESFFEREYERE